MDQEHTTPQHTIRPWRPNVDVSGLLSEWRSLAQKVTKAWRGTSAVDEIREQRTKPYDTHDR